MTIKELKDYYFKFLNIDIKPKINISDDYEITEEDIESGRIFQKYVSGNTLTKNVNGFAVIEHNIYYIYTELYRIEILTDDFFSPCGGENEIMVNAFYAIKGMGISNSDIVLSGDNYLLSPINAIIKTNNTLFTYEKPYIVNKQANNTDKDIEVTISATYYYKGVKYEDSKTIIQSTNINSPWLIEEEPTQSINLILSEKEISNKGGIVMAKVERTFTRVFFKKDSCGNKIDSKSEIGLTEDITKKCIISSSNKKHFIVNKNIINVIKQKIGEPEKECVITARYLDKEATETIVQKEGGKISYVYELSFSGGEKTQYVDFETSLPIERKIPIISKEYKYIDDEFISVSNATNLTIESDSDWVCGEITECDDNVNLSVNITSINTDKNNDREAVLKIINKSKPNILIKLIVAQQALEITKIDHCCEFVGNGVYTSEELDKSELYFQPHKLLIYENGEKVKEKIEKHYDYKIITDSSYDDLLKIDSINIKDDKYFVIFDNLTKYSSKDISLIAQLVFFDESGEKIFESDKANIVVKANQIVDYKYELCFDEHNKFKNVEWTNSTEPKYIKINSLKHKTINGKYSGKEIAPYKIGIYDTNGKECFDDAFSIKIINDEILVFPIKTDRNIENTYIITQKESDLKISLHLSYKIENDSHKIPLKVIIYSNNVEKDIWTGENGYVLIDGKESIKLNPCWLSPTMKDNIDIAYNGIIELKNGIHTFETFNILCFDSISKKHKNCNIYNEIEIDNTTKNITIKVKV